MNVIDIMIDGFKKVYSGKNVLSKHFFMFIIIAILSISTVNVQIMANAIENTKEIPNISQLLICLAITIIIGIYTGGYNLLFSHNAFNRENKDILPEITLTPFKVFLKTLPLMIIWSLYILVAIFFSMFLISSKSLLTVLGIFLFLFLLFLCAFVNFVYIAYIKNFDSNGLFNINLPFKYMQKSFSDFVLLGLLFIPVYGVAMTPSFIVGLLFGLLGAKTIMALYAGGILGGYLGFIVQIVWYYSLVQIYKNKIEPNL